MVTCEDLGYDTCRNCGNGRQGYTGCVPRGTNQDHIVYPSFYINNSTGNTAQNYTSGTGIDIADITAQNIKTLPFVSFPTFLTNTLVNDKPTQENVSSMTNSSLLQNLANVNSIIPRTTPDVSSPSTGLKLPNLSNVSPILLIGGAALLILILK